MRLGLAEKLKSKKSYGELPLPSVMRVIMDLDAWLEAGHDNNSSMPGYGR